MDVTKPFIDAVAVIEQYRAEGVDTDYVTFIEGLGLEADEEHALKQALVHVLDQMGRNGGVYTPDNPIVYVTDEAVPVPEPKLEGMAPE